LPKAMFQDEIRAAPSSSLFKRGEPESSRNPHPQQPIPARIDAEDDAGCPLRRKLSAPGICAALLPRRKWDSILEKKNAAKGTVEKIAATRYPVWSTQHVLNRRRGAFARSSPGAVLPVPARNSLPTHHCREKRRLTGRPHGTCGQPVSRPPLPAVDTPQSLHLPYFVPHSGPRKKTSGPPLLFSAPRAI